MATAALPVRASAALDASFGEIKTAPDRLRMAASELPVGAVIHLGESGREGLFACVDGPSPIVDALQGLYVSASGARRHFARVWDGTNGRPEWFGARINDWRFDCADAIEACFALCPVSHLGQADYFVRRTVVLSNGWRTLAGVGGYAADQGQGNDVALGAMRGEYKLTSPQVVRLQDGIARDDFRWFSDITHVEVDNWWAQDGARLIANSFAVRQ